MGQPSSRENGDLLSSSNAIHAINGRDASLDHLLRVDTALRIDGLTWETETCIQLDTKEAIAHFTVHHTGQSHRLDQTKHATEKT